MQRQILIFCIWHKYLGSVTLPVPYWPQFRRFDVPSKRIRLYWLQIIYFYHLERQILKMEAIWMLKDLNILFYDFLSFSVFHDVWMFHGFNVVLHGTLANLCHRSNEIRQIWRDRSTNCYDIHDDSHRPFRYWRFLYLYSFKNKLTLLKNYEKGCRNVKNCGGYILFPWLINLPKYGEVERI